MSFLLPLLLVVSVVVGGFGWGWLQLRRSVAAAQASLTSLRADDVERLAEECRVALRDKLRDPLPDDPAEAAALLDRLTRSPAVKDTFATPELYWRFVHPLGALLGELIRKHGKARWIDDPEQGLLLRVELPDGRELTSRPFERVLRHRLSGRPGELRAYVLFAIGQSPASPG